MAYLESSKVDIFPISHARTANPYARSLSEDHITKLIRSIVDKDSFVVEYNESNILTFVLNGYVIQITDPVSSIGSALENSHDIIYGVIIVDTRARAGEKTGKNYFILRGIEKEDIYLGVQLIPESSSTPMSNISPDLPKDNSFSATYTSYKLPVLQKISGVWKVPESSLYKFTGSSIVNIDGGIV